MNELKKAMDAGRYTVDWSNKSIVVSDALALFAIDYTYPEDLATVRGAVTIDLTENRMGGLEEGDLLTILRVVKRLSCMPGDVDCLVTGLLVDDGVEERVVVLGEVKHNMQNKYAEAASQIRKNYQRWRKLCDLQAAPLQGEEGYADYLALKISQLKSYRMILAFGGNLFPKAIDYEIRLENSVALQCLKPLKLLKFAPDSGTMILISPQND